MILLGYTNLSAQSSSQQVLARFIGQRASEITFKTIPDDPAFPNHMVYEIEAKDGKVTISGNSGVAQCN